MELPSFLQYALELSPFIKYPAIFFGTIVGGPALILASGFLLRLGVLELAPLFLALACGELLLDTLWYWLGYHYGDRAVIKFGRFFSLTPKTFEKIKKLFHRYHSSILFTSKVLMGLGMIIAILITAGATRMSFRKYMFVNTLGEVVWLSGMLAIGYFVGELYTQVAEGLRVVFLVGVGSALLVVLYGFGRYLGKKTLRSVN